MSRLVTLAPRGAVREQDPLKVFPSRADAEAELSEYARWLTRRGLGRRMCVGVRPVKQDGHPTGWYGIYLRER